MNLASLAQRLARLEGRQGTGPITAICNLANHPPAVAADAHSGLASLDRHRPRTPHRIDPHPARRAADRSRMVRAVQSSSPEPVVKLIDLERRLAHVEAARSVTAPTRILTDRALGDPAGDLEAADALANWRQWVAQGRATVRHGVLCVARSSITAEEWANRFVTEG